MLSKKLCAWYLTNKRDLPWRKTKNPYGIFLSEIMLQQTTVKTVLPYYDKFLKSFPDIESLATAPESKVLALWSGLGYYSRARNLHQAAKTIVQKGTFPKTFNELLRLKGVGPYTAAAVASIAYEESVPVIDGNVVRVITRLFDINENVCLSSTQNKIKKISEELIKDQKPSIHNQAMMELGATLCTPQNPSCLLCPLLNDCESNKNGTSLLRPVKTPRKKPVSWLWTVQFIYKNGRVALTKRDNETPWLKNMWVFPGTAKPLTSDRKLKWDFKHSITHHNIFVVVQHSENRDDLKNIKWVHPHKIKNIGVSSIVLKILNSKGLL